MATNVTKAKKVAEVKAVVAEAPVVTSVVASDKKNYPINTRSKAWTIRGIAVFPRVNVPDTKFKDQGEYSLKIGKDAEDAQKLIAALEKFYNDGYQPMCEKEKKKSLKRAVTRPWAPEVDKDSEEETGQILFTVKAGASGVSKKTGKKWKFELPLFDAKMKPTTKVVWGGSEVVVSFEPYVWYTAALGYGISLRLNGVQVINLVTGGARDASALGFTEEDGYEDEGAAPATDTKTTSNDDSDSDSDDSTNDATDY